MTDINFYNEDCLYALPDPGKISRWIDEAITAEGCEGGEVSIIFCSDEHLLKINREYLDHDYYTDIITFDYCETEEFFNFSEEEECDASEAKTVSGDLFISIDTVRTNSELYGVTFEKELDRVMIHGILHLIGYKDKSESEAAEMRSKEDYYLTRL